MSICFFPFFKNFQQIHRSIADPCIVFLTHVDDDRLIDFLRERQLLFQNIVLKRASGEGPMIPLTTDETRLNQSLVRDPCVAEGLPRTLFLIPSRILTRLPGSSL